MLIGKFIVLNAYIRKEERATVNNLGFHLSKLGKEEQINFKISSKI